MPWLVMPGSHVHYQSQESGSARMAWSEWEKGSSLRDNGVPCKEKENEECWWGKNHNDKDTKTHSLQGFRVSLDPGYAWLGVALAALNHLGLLCHKIQLDLAETIKWIYVLMYLKSPEVGLASTESKPPEDLAPTISPLVTFPPPDCTQRLLVTRLSPRVADCSGSSTPQILTQHQVWPRDIESFLICSTLGLWLSPLSLAQIGTI